MIVLQKEYFDILEYYERDTDGLPTSWNGRWTSKFFTWELLIKDLPIEKTIPTDLIETVARNKELIEDLNPTAIACELLPTEIETDINTTEIFCDTSTNKSLEINESFSTAIEV